MPVKPPRELPFFLRAIRHRNYKLFFAGQGVSLIGTWVSRLATGYLVYDLTKSPWLLGVVGFAAQFPTFVLTPFGGVLTDRVDRHRVMVATQIVSMLQSFILAALALSGTITVLDIILLSVLQGVTNAFDIPARQAFVVEMIEDRADLANAIALNSSMFNGARLIGPTLAAGMIWLTSAGWCFLIDGVSYLAVIAALLAMRVPAFKPRVARPVISELREGFAYAFGFPPIRAILLLVAAMSFAGGPYLVLMPAISEKVFRGGAMTLGLLTAAGGFGALIGGTYLASRRTVLGLGRVIAASGVGFGLTLVGFGFCDVLWLAMVLLVIAGAAMIVVMAASNTILQTLVDEEKRGRVMSLFAMGVIGMMPLGSLIAGRLSESFGAPHTLSMGGGLCVLAGLGFALVLPTLRPHVRPIYQARGILPEIAEGLRAAQPLSVAGER